MPKNIAFCADGTWDNPNNNSMVLGIIPTTIQMYVSFTRFWTI